RRTGKPGRSDHRHRLPHLLVGGLLIEEVRVAALGIGSCSIRYHQRAASTVEEMRRAIIREAKAKRVEWWRRFFGTHSKLIWESLICALDETASLASGHST